MGKQLPIEAHVLMIVVGVTFRETLYTALLPMTKSAIAFEPLAHGKLH